MAYTEDDNNGGGGGIDADGNVDGYDKVTFLNV